MFINNSTTYYNISNKKKLKPRTLRNTNILLLQQNIAEGPSALISFRRMDMLSEIYRGCIQYLRHNDGMF